MSEDHTCTVITFCQLTFFPRQLSVYGKRVISHVLLMFSTVLLSTGEMLLNAVNKHMKYHGSLLVAIVCSSHQIPKVIGDKE